MKKFDYSVIAVPVPYDQARREVTEIPKQFKNARIAFIGIGVLLVVQIIVMRAYEHLQIIPLLLVPYALVAGYFYWKFRRDIQRIAGIYRFASANDMHAIASSSSDQYPGTLFNDGHTREVVMALRTKDDKEPIEIGNYRFVTGHGRSARNHDFTYMLIKLDKVLPHIFIDSKSNNSFWNREHASDYAKSQHLQFEGDFNKYFKALVPEDYGRDANYIFTPDVLQALLQYGKEYDFELMGDTLIMFKRGQVNLADPKNLEVMLSKVTMFATKFRKQTKLYKDDRVVTEAMGTIAPEGKKLRSAFPWFLVLVLGYFAVSIFIRVFAR
ncbi:MAG: hypothetical protein ABIQ64_01990 [Candidatus Saccharimonadales bacterium]